MLRRKLLVVLAGLAVVVAAGAAVLWPPTDRITQENYDLIRMGMSRAEVQETLGSPGDYRTRLGETRYGPGETWGGWTADADVDPSPVRVQIVSRDYLIFQEYFQEDPRRWELWQSDSFAITIRFDESGRVLSKDVSERRGTGNAIGNLLWRAKHQWRRWFPE